MSEIYYKTRITLEVLSEDSIYGNGLNWIVCECAIGNLVMASVIGNEQIRTAEEMTEDLIEAGSEPNFFGIEENQDPGGHA